MITIDDSNYELWLLRYAEQELTAEEREAVEAWLAEHPEAAEELALYNDAPRLVKDVSVRFAAAVSPRTEPLWPAMLRWSAAAAVVAALMVPAIGGITEMERIAPIGVELAAVQQTDTEVPEVDTIVTAVQKSAVVLQREEPLIAEVMEQEEEPVADEPEGLPTDVSQPMTVPEVIYCDNLIAYESAPDTVYTNDLIAYDDSRRSWTEDVKEWAAETKLAQWVRRRIQARGNDLIAMN